MDTARICIVGGTGFVGRSIAAQAAGRGMLVRVVTRRAAHARPLLVLPTIEIAEARSYDEATLAEHFRGMDAVVNLVGILHEGGGATFQSVHAELPGIVARACRAAGVKRLLHMSALGASPAGPSAYQRSKAAGEEAVRASGEAIAFTILRPSVIFGEHDAFLNVFARLVRLAPVIPLAAAQSRLQPIWVEDVARCFVQSLDDPRTFGQAYDLCGPRSYALDELIGFVGRILGRKPAIVPLPGALAYLQALALEHLPGKMMTRDNLRSLSVDNVSREPFPAAFGFKPAALEAIVPSYLTRR